jgi:RpiB/LacA/LacB family sugar-phosphate isomerase
MEETFGKRIEGVVGRTFGGEESGSGKSAAAAGRSSVAAERTPGSTRSRLKVALGSDHRGLTLKGQLREYLEEMGHTVVDCAAAGTKAPDYPDVALAVCREVASKTCDFGIVIDAVGIGSAIAANKIKGIRAATCYDVESARSSRLHNDANVLSLGAGFVNRGLARRMVRIWLETPFEGGRHMPRIEKIAKIERDGLDA